MPLYDLITPTSRDAEAEPAETFATLNCKSLPSVSVQKPGHAQSEAKTMMKQNSQANKGFATRGIQQFEAVKPESTQTQVNTRKPNDRPTSHSLFESAPEGDTSRSHLFWVQDRLCALTHV